MRRLILAACLACCAGSCHACKEEHDDDDDGEEQEEREDRRLHYWRAQIAIVGEGTVKTAAAAFDCTSRGAGQSGDCGPKLVTFDELEPPLMRADGAPGWRFSHWESRTRHLDGHVTSREGPMPDGPLYLNGFGYSDTGALETVTAIFVPDDAYRARL